LIRCSAPPSLLPRVGHQENQDYQADHQKHDRPGLFLPQLLKSSRYFVHANRIYEKQRPCRAEWPLSQALRSGAAPGALPLLDGVANAEPKHGLQSKKLAGRQDCASMAWLGQLNWPVLSRPEAL